MKFLDVSTIFFSLSILVFTVFIQYYSTSLNNSLENLSSLKNDYEKIEQEILSISAVADQKSIENKESYKTLLIKKSTLLMQLQPAAIRQEELNNVSISSFARRVSEVLFSSKPDKEQLGSSAPKTDKTHPQPGLEQTNNVDPNSGTDPLQKNDRTIPDTVSFQSCNDQKLPKSNNELACFLSSVDKTLREGKSNEKTLNTILLPLFMGIIGALAYLIRNKLRHIENHSYIPAKDQSYFFRVIMGGLLGFMGPMLYTSGKVDDFGVGLSLFAFLLGYSFELAFGVLDKFINFLRDAIKPGEDKDKDEKVKQSKIADNPDDAAPNNKNGKSNELDDRSPSTNDNKQSTVSDIDNLKSYQSHGRLLRELIALEPVLQASVQPEFYAEECAGKIQTAKVLLEQLESAYQTHGSDQVKFKEELDQISTAIAAIDGSNNPLAIWLNFAKQSFCATTGDNEEKSKSLIITLFAAAVAAFRNGSEAFERWIAYAWAQPFTNKCFAGLAFSAQEVDQCLKSSSMFYQAFQNQSNLAEKLVDFAKESFTDQELAERIWQDPTSLKGVTPEFLTAAFGSIEVFAEGWKEFRHNLLRIVLRNKDFPSDRFIADDLSLLSVSDTLNAIDLLRQDAGAEKDLDVICYLAQELMKQAQTNASLDTIALIKRLLGGES